MDQEPSMKSRWNTKTTALVIGAGILLVVGGVVAYDLFAPKATTRVDQGLGEGVGASDGDAMMDQDGAMADEPMAGGDGMQAGFTALKSGSFEGADSFHKVSGTVTLYHGPDGHFLRFEDYEATSGPDVFFFLSESPDASWQGGERMKVRTPGGAEDGQATVRGTFNVPLPAEFDPAMWNSVIVWCEDFSVKFGGASMA